MKRIWMRLFAAVLIGCLALSGMALGEVVDADRDTIQLVQEELNAAGYSCGKADGLIGWRTILAIQNYEKASGWKVTGKITTELLEALGIALPSDEEDPAEEPAEEPMDVPADEQIGRAHV